MKTTLTKHSILPKTQIKNAYRKAVEDVCYQTNKDYINLSTKAKSQKQVGKEDFIKKAQKFFSTAFGQ